MMIKMDAVDVMALDLCSRPTAHNILDEVRRWVFKSRGMAYNRRRKITIGEYCRYFGYDVNEIGRALRGDAWVDV